MPLRQEQLELLVYCNSLRLHSGSELQACNGEALDLGKGNVRPLCRWVSNFLVDSGGRAAALKPSRSVAPKKNFKWSRQTPGTRNRTCNDP